MNKKDYEIHYLCFERQSSDGAYTTRYISEEEFSTCDFGAMFYVQKPTGRFYQWSHDYAFHLVFYKEGLPTIVEENNWNIGPTVNGFFINMSHLYSQRDGLRFDLCLKLRRNNFSSNKDFVYDEEFYHKGKYYHGMLQRIAEVPELVMDIVHKQSSTSDMN